MITFANGLEYKYNLNDKKFRTAFEFLKRNDLADLEPGKFDIEDGVRVQVHEYNSKEWEDCKWETHDNYFDIQYIVSGKEYMGVCSRDELTEVLTPYIPERDITFYKEPEVYGKILVRAGEFAVFAPEDGHKPSALVSKSIPIKKIVLKVPVKAVTSR